MEAITWKIKKEDFGFVKYLNPILGDVEYVVDDTGIKITAKDQMKLYSWKDLKFFWPNNLNLRYGYFGGSGFKNLMRNANTIKNLPNEKIGEIFWIYFKSSSLRDEKPSKLPLYTAGSNTKDVFVALKSRLPIWNNFLYIRVVGHAIGHLVFILGFLISAYYAIFEKRTPVFGLLSGVVVLFLLFRCVQNIRYFSKFYKQQWQKH